MKKSILPLLPPSSHPLPTPQPSSHQTPATPPSLRHSHTIIIITIDHLHTAPPPYLISSTLCRHPFPRSLSRRVPTHEQPPSYVISSMPHTVASPHHHYCTNPLLVRDLHPCIISTFEAPWGQLLSTITMSLCTSTVVHSSAIMESHFRMHIWLHKICDSIGLNGVKKIYTTEERNHVSVVYIFFTPT